MRFILIFSFIAVVTCSNSDKIDRGHKVTHTVWFEITMGTKKIPEKIVFGLFGKVVPITVHNFFKLARRPKGDGYKGSKIDAIKKTEFIAGGAWAKDGKKMIGRSAYDNPEFDNENLDIKIYGAGWVCSDPYGKDMHTSLFIISLKKLFFSNCVVFAKVISGMPIVRKIARLPTKGRRPTIDVVVSDCGGRLLDVPFYVPKTNATE